MPVNQPLVHTEVSNGLPLLLPTPAFSLPLLISLLTPPPSLSLIAVPLMPPAQSQPRPAASPQRFPVSSSCSPVSVNSVDLFVREMSLWQLDAHSGPNTVRANL